MRSPAAQNKRPGHSLLLWFPPVPWRSHSSWTRTCVLHLFTSFLSPGVLSFLLPSVLCWLKLACTFPIWRKVPSRPCILSFKSPVLFPFLSWLLRSIGCPLQFSSVTQLCLTLCDLMDWGTPGFPVHHQLPELTQTRVHQVGEAIQPSHPLLSPSLPATSFSQHQGLFQWVSSLHHVAKVLELQHQSFQWIFRVDFL